MNKLARIAAGALTALCASTAVAAAADAPATAPINPNTVCLWTYLIDHTHFISPRTILFYMRNGKIWQNTLVNDCPGLNFYGFEYVTRDGQICSNMQSIHVLRTHEVCLLGAFTPYTPPEKAPPAPK